MVHYSLMSIRVALAIAMVGIVTAGCGAVQDQRQELHASLVHIYQSLDELKDDSTVVIVGTAGQAVNDTLNGVPITVTDVTVMEVLDGQLKQGTIAVLQLGTKSVLSPDTSVLLQQHAKYLLFLSDFHVIPGDSTGRYVITGDQGIFAWRDGAYGYSGTPLPDPSQSLPRVIEEGKAITLIQAH